MMLADFWVHPAVIGLLVGAPSAVLGYLGYRRSRQIDEVAKQAGIASTQSSSIGQVVAGQNTIIANLQEDNRVLRGDHARVVALVETCQVRLDALEAGNTDLQAQNRELEREVAVLHVENEALKVENEALKARLVVLEKGGTQ